jgi:N-methylhydantoinase A
MIRVGVDVGGTFTDVVLERTGGGAQQKVIVANAPSTPADQSEGVLQGIHKVCALAGVEPGAIDAVPRDHGRDQYGDRALRRRGRWMTDTGGAQGRGHKGTARRNARVKAMEQQADFAPDFVCRTSGAGR